MRAVAGVLLDDVGSTMDEARWMAGGGEALPFFVAARRQSAGRGRLGRAWASPEGGVWMTLAWPCAARRGEVYAPASLVCGLAVLEAIAQAGKHAGVADAGAALRLKWPNDVLLQGKKVAGVLCERVTIGPAQGAGGAALLLVGVGVNANVGIEELPTSTRFPLTTLRHQWEREVDIERLRSGIGAGLVSALGEFERGVQERDPWPGQALGEPARQELERVLAFREQVVELALATRRVKGRVLGLDGAGRLMVDVAGEGPAAFASGEIESWTTG